MNAPLEGVVIVSDGSEIRSRVEYCGDEPMMLAQMVPNAAVLVCGSTREAGLAQEIVDAVGSLTGEGRVINVAARKPTLERLVALAARAHSMISVDTGPAHVAGAMDCPLVVLYGQAGWGRWKPRAPSSEVIVLGPQEPTPSAKLMDLDPEQVLAAWRSLAPRRGAPAVMPALSR